ncbi:MAG: hypothetical protein V4620_07245 [Bacteroidota bacterium]
METKTCATCGEPLKGRIDKKFCDDACRSNFNNRLNSDASAFVKLVNNILRKNRRIIEELIPENESKTSVSLKKLQDKGFNFSYHTHTYVTKAGVTYLFCYEYGYLPLEGNFFTLVRQER